MAVVEGKSELLRGIPNFRKSSDGYSGGKRSLVNVNPVPAGIIRQGGLPKNGHELARELKRHQVAEEKVRWLATIPSDAYSRIFSVEMDAELLQTMLVAMHAAISRPEDAAEVRRILVAVADGCPKALGFAASFASPKEKKRVEDLLSTLEAAGEKAELSLARQLLLGEV
eukprot:CAMPEP_0197651378 /NCGR_PEP_ID=MMETSP1338-20131121/32249_1 /TAXON_ID=43686 ORGANISM="Pelagodinium beii, Strain RCC1491" /NCGR_SAMPLE_ID=MMETSP1338 /ASSEMBLY_ACC=CAM_ASM_000754 /LENGTH=169 /DNA_ID=CAMNT_0043225997 /DNA_START=38 /DNA_END=547 /DNA_ORIENTATION=-